MYIYLYANSGSFKVTIRIEAELECKGVRELASTDRVFIKLPENQNCQYDLLGAILWKERKRKRERIKKRKRTQDVTKCKNRKEKKQSF